MRIRSWSTFVTKSSLPCTRRREALRFAKMWILVALNLLLVHTHEYCNRGQEHVLTTGHAEGSGVAETDWGLRGSGRDQSKTTRLCFIKGALTLRQQMKSSPTQVTSPFAEAGNIFSFLTRHNPQEHHTRCPLSLTPSLLLPITAITRLP